MKSELFPKVILKWSRHSGSHFLPDTELTRVFLDRRGSGERVVCQPSAQVSAVLAWHRTCPRPCSGRRGRDPESSRLPRSSPAGDRKLATTTSMPDHGPCDRWADERVSPTGA